MRYLKPILKPFSFLPALFMLYVIFQFSAQPGEVSGNLSWRATHKLLEIICESFETGWSSAELNLYTEMLHPYVRKLAHVTEYFLLAVAVSFPFYVYGLRGFPLMLVAGFICVAFAAGDEYHQSFVAGRGPSVKDVGIDSIGAFFGIMTVQIICWVFLAPARSARRQEEFAYRKRARREEAQRRREYIRRQEAARRRRSRY